MKKSNNNFVRNGRTHFLENGQTQFLNNNNNQPSFSSNGQPSHFATIEQRVAALTTNPKYGKNNQNSKQTCFFILYTILLFLVCTGFVGFSYYLYDRQNSIQSRQNSIQSFSKQISFLYDEIQRLQNKLDNLTVLKPNNVTSSNYQTMLQESDSSKYKAKAVEIVDEYPEIEDLDDGNLMISTDEYNNDEYDDDETTDNIASTVNNNKNTNNNDKFIEDNNMNVYNNNGDNNNNYPHLPVQQNISSSINSLSDYTIARIKRRTRRNAEIISSSADNNRHHHSQQQAKRNDLELLFNNDTKPDDNSQNFDSIENKNSNNGENRKGKGGNAVLIKGSMITMPFTDFIEYFKNSQANDDTKNFINSSKKYENCSMTIKTNFFNNGPPLFDGKESSHRGRSRVESSEEIIDSIPNVHRNSNSHIKPNRDRGRNIQKMNRQMVRRFDSNRNSKLGSIWNKESDVEIMSDKDEPDGILQIQPRSLVSVVAAHFGGDSSKYNTKIHEHYKGNGRLRHANGEHKDWQASSWFQELDMNQHFTLKDGNLTVHRNGLYFVYAQIFYSDLFDVNGYAVMKNSEQVLHCITSSLFNEPVIKSNTCYTGAVLNCEAGDILSIKTIETDRHVVLHHSKSFFGMFKIGEFPMK